MKSVSKAFFIFVILAGCSSIKNEVKKPNIILLLTDDLGYNDLSIHGNSIFETPNIDRLARESVQFSRFYVNPVCAPTRASLLTGRDYIRTGVSHVHGGKDFIDLSETLLSEALKSNGYRTGMWGKWHSGTTRGYLPQDRGFDEVFMADLYLHENPTGVFNGTPVQHQGWVDSILVDYAIDFIQKESNPNQPFFAYIPFLAPHMPIKAPRRSIEKYLAEGLSESHATLAGMIDQLDRQVGRLQKYLKENDLEHNTMIIFLSDNGPQHLGGFLTEKEESQRNFSGLKGHKGNIWELGVRSPLFVKYHAFEPRREASLSSIIDLYPTLVELAGGIFPNDQLPVDGKSLVSILCAKSKNEDRSIFNFASQGWAPSKDIPYTLDGLDGEYDPVIKKDLSIANQIISVHSGKYKLLLNPSTTDLDTAHPDSVVLINLENDPFETRNIAKTHPEITGHLFTEATNWFEQVLQSDHAFQMPTFLISSEIDQNLIPAKAPMAIHGGVKNTVLSLKYWRTNEDYASYQAFVEQPATYNIGIEYDGICESEPPVNMLFLSKEDTFICELHASGRSTFGTLFLPEGLHTFTIQLGTNTPINCENAIESLEEIVFSPIL